MKSLSSFCTLSHEQVNRLSNKILIHGKLRTPHSQKFFPILHSAQSKKVAEQADCDEQDVNDAVDSAVASKKDWATLTPRKRGSLIRDGLALVKREKQEIVQLLTLETSKAISTESEADFHAAMDILDFYSGLGSELKGQTIPYRSDVLVYTQREPIGVVAAIIPWNVPLMLLALKIGPALVAGNTVVVKTSEYAPLAVLRFAELLSEALPPGVLSVLSGHGTPTGEALVNHPLIGKITFTGSGATGKRIYQKAAERLVPVTLELGGKSPMIVCEDADLEKVVQGAFTGMRFTRQGQSCSAASRIFVHESLYDSFLEKLGSRLDNLVIGDPFDPATEAGAIACQMQYEKIQGFLKALRPDQSQSYGKLPGANSLQEGLFLTPTIVTGAADDDAVVREEVFGPVVCVLKWKTLEEVIERANKTPYGLAATIWTQNIHRALGMVDRLEAGFVQVNQNLVVQATLSYGGYKHSGLGKEASLEAMVEHYTKSKTVLIAK